MLKLYVLAGIALTGWLLYLLAPILTPFMAAAVLSYLFNPLVTRMAAWHLGRAGATTVVFLIFALMLVGIALVLLPVVQNQAMLFIDALPKYISRLQELLLPWLEQHFGLSLEVGGLNEAK